MTQDLIDLDNRYHDYLRHLTTITEGLIEMARAAGRTGFTRNLLLRECYDLVGAELRTLTEWHELGRKVRESEHGYLFWNDDKIQMLFAKTQLEDEQ